MADSRKTVTKSRSSLVVWSGCEGSAEVHNLTWTLRVISDKSLIQCKWKLIHAFLNFGQRNKQFHKNACISQYIYPPVQRGHLTTAGRLQSLKTSLSAVMASSWNRTNSIEQSPSSQAHIFSACQQIPHVHVTRKFITEFTTASHLSSAEQEHLTTRPVIQFLKIHLNIILPSTPRFSK